MSSLPPSQAGITKLSTQAYHLNRTSLAKGMDLLKSRDLGDNSQEKLNNAASVAQRQSTRLIKQKSWISHLDQLVPLLFRLFNEPTDRSLAEELHEAALHDQPEAPRQVEDHRHEDQVDGDPLVVGVVDGPLDVILKEILKRIYSASISSLPSVPRT